MHLWIIARKVMGLEPKEMFARELGYCGIAFFDGLEGLKVKDIDVF